MLLIIIGSLVHSTWLYSHFTSLSLSLYDSYHLISFAIRPSIVSIVSENKPPSSLHSCLVGFYRHSKSPHSSSLLFSHLLICKYLLSLSFHFVRKSLSFMKRAWVSDRRDQCKYQANRVVALGFNHKQTHLPVGLTSVLWCISTNSAHTEPSANTQIYNI